MGAVPGPGDGGGRLRRGGGRACRGCCRARTVSGRCCWSRRASPRACRLICGEAALCMDAVNAARVAAAVLPCGRPPGAVVTEAGR